MCASWSREETRPHRSVSELLLVSRAAEIEVLNPVKETRPQKGRGVELYTSFHVGLYVNDYILGGGYFEGVCILHKELS